MALAEVIELTGVEEVVLPLVAEAGGDKNMTKLLPILFLIAWTAITYDLGFKNVPTTIEVWNGTQRVETIESRIEINGVWHWWVFAKEDLSLIDYYRFWESE